MSWCFAKLNGRLAEIFFDKKQNGDPAIFAHAYIERNEYSKRERKQIDKDIQKFVLTYRHKRYYDQIGKRWLPESNTSLKGEALTALTIEEVAKILKI